MNDSHRPWSIPSRPWVMKQTWHDLLFAHWKIDPTIIKPLIPSSLQLDTYDGEAWIGVVPFDMSGIRIKYMPPIPYTSSFPEINVRTYVTYEGKPGVYFFSLDAANLLAVKAARAFFYLPYYNADITVQKEGDKVYYESIRKDSSKPCHFKGWYKPVSEVFFARKGSLEHWLTERYCLYTTHKTSLYRGEIHHQPWKLQNAEGEISLNTMIPLEASPSPDKLPLLHYSDQLDVVLWGLEKLEV
ncbi:YqjF family protein [Alkalihalobacillus sp. AL-G]|uniref:YqjF family protein n=1 Tax=Alkalihalobacillus sp. AL-G TaxID=2926399 RepID=UPI00272C4454|nr:DUF2071 domain-containing protein [Alkalihalobacillus sp. AL-G]WLD93049.1 DUF2071 domain-containing protein [Alkalihalobacillus sp. AL-G]